ncbi:LOW QUALITY PROTEIN: isoamyl acetate-hydrolyzing esterase 1 homolog [Haliotis rubra]|uniref:LOW QUALITY PROTEIN: isoamyl acetate-hydrolyzing esterase 1 homolog n=1 Tax=Haliotis rubra TaxID=36100 RepID=UPI001EE5AFF9|nr:LOW QUALITY PROTEIN: isoamyl acetate-hydrolyzing esterase 1 homolog [Haliotis rubra]
MKAIKQVLHVYLFGKLMITGFLHNPAGKCDVINRGFSRYNARWCKFVLPQISSAADDAASVAAVTIFLGANDSNDGDLNPTQHCPQRLYRRPDRDGGIFAVYRHPERESSLITPPPCDENAWGEECKKKGKPMSKSNTLTELYAKVCAKVASDCGTQCVDLYKAVMKSEEWKNMLCDGLHLSQTGSHLLFTLLQPIVDKLTSDVVFKFPLWDEVDYMNPKVSLCSTNTSS